MPSGRTVTTQTEKDANTPNMKGPQHLGVFTLKFADLSKWRRYELKDKDRGFSVSPVGIGPSYVDILHFTPDSPADRLGQDFLKGSYKGEPKATFIKALRVKDSSGRVKNVPLAALTVSGDLVTAVHSPGGPGRVPSVMIMIVRDRDHNNKVGMNDVMLIHAVNHTEIDNAVLGDEVTLAYEVMRAYYAGSR